MYNNKINKLLLLLVIFIFSASFVYFNQAKAIDYEPLVRIPGLPATGGVTLSMYLVGLYNFLLSIVGIIAVMMMILGGVKYITAAGSESAIGDAKAMITGAIFGLMLAILTWVIVNTINPDVLFIKPPGEQQICTAGECVKIYCSQSKQCVCKNGDSSTADTMSICISNCNDNCDDW